MSIKISILFFKTGILLLNTKKMAFVGEGLEQLRAIYKKNLPKDGTESKVKLDTFEIAAQKYLNAAYERDDKMTKYYKKSLSSLVEEMRNA